MNYQTQNGRVIVTDKKLHDLNMVEDEKLDDTIEDLINYCYLFLIRK